MTKRSVIHDTFTLERRYAHPPSKVFAAWAEPEAKQRWFGSGDGVTVDRFDMDFRVGGDEITSGKTPDGATYLYEGRYLEIVVKARIIYSYLMHVEDQFLSVSNATVQIHEDPDGVRLVYTEQAAFLDGLDDAPSRAGGTEQLLDALGTELDATP